MEGNLARNHSKFCVRFTKSIPALFLIISGSNLAGIFPRRVAPSDLAWMNGLFVLLWIPRPLLFYWRVARNRRRGVLVRGLGAPVLHWRRSPLVSAFS